MLTVSRKHANVRIKYVAHAPGGSVTNIVCQPHPTGILVVLHADRIALLEASEVPAKGDALVVNIVQLRVVDRRWMPHGVCVLVCEADE